MTSHYIHGTSPEEQRRLSRLNDLLNAGSLREAALQPGERVIDFGCGLGQLSRAMARVTGVPVVGVERSAAQIATALALADDAGERDLIDLREAPVESPPLSDHEWAAFDVAHARFLLEHVPDPLTVVRSMVRAVRPGGRIILQDDDHGVMRLWPEPPGFTALWDAYMRTYDRHGNDPLVGRRLVQLLHQAGAQPRRNTWIFFGSCAGASDFPDFVANLHGVLAGALEAILETGLPRELALGALEALIAWQQRPDAAIWFAMAYAEGHRLG
ncbi:MAG TPA: methyltransferase domain-containing protein [Vicinamibacterales bacterium]|jgi:SAM-dependent methyltransferase